MIYKSFNFTFFRDCERCFRLNRFYGRPNHILFVGDSRVRQLYHAIRGLNMDGSDPDVYISSESVKGIPQLYDSPEQNLKLEYKVREMDLNLLHMSSTSFLLPVKNFLRMPQPRWV